MSVKFSAALACLALLTPVHSLGIILDCEVATDGTYTCVEIHGTVVTEDARRKAKEEQRMYYERALDKCEYKEPRRHAMGKTGGARLMEERKRAQAEYDACVARKAEEMRKADKADSR
jgi:hypothetical protein